VATEGEEEVKDMQIPKQVEREAKAVPCLCGGYADRVDTSVAERTEYGCHRDLTFECCARAFVCRVCKVRLVGQAQAPEMD